MQIGRYRVYREIARGGMATVHLGRLASDLGLGKIVAVKRLHPQIASDPEFRTMFVDEARVASRIRHPNVVGLLDLVTNQDELCMILEYVDGETLSNLNRRSAEQGNRVPASIVSSVICGSLRGLHAAHEARSEDGQALGIVHRDVSPQNILVGVDGLARVADFGVAKAIVRAQTTRDGQVKGKLSYMPPEQVNGDKALDRRGDVFAAGVVLWETLVQRRLFQGEGEGQILMKILTGAVDPPSEVASGVDARWDDVVMRALALSPDARYPTALDMAVDIESRFPPASLEVVGAWVRQAAPAAIPARAEWVGEIEREPAGSDRTALPTVSDVTRVEGRAVPSPDVPPIAEPPSPARGKTWMILAVVVGVVAAVPFGMRAPVAPPTLHRLELPTVAKLSSPAPAAEPGPSATVSAALPPTVPDPPPRPRPKPNTGCRVERYFDAKEGIAKFRENCAHRP